MKKDEHAHVSASELKKGNRKKGLRRQQEPWEPPGYSHGSVGVGSLTLQKQTRDRPVQRDRSRGTGRQQKTDWGTSASFHFDSDASQKPTRVCIKLQVLSPQNDACRLQGWLYDLDVDVGFLSCWVKGSSACTHGNSDKHESSWNQPKLPPVSLPCFFFFF